MNIEPGGTFYISETTISTLRPQNIYKLCYRVSYGAQDSDVSAKSIYPTLFRTVPSEQSQNDGFVQLLKYFGWIWVGIITTDDENDLRWSNEMKNILIKNEICIAYFQIISNRALTSLYQAMNVIKSSSANVIFFFPSNIDFINIMFTFQIYSMPGKVWIFPSTVTLPAQDSYLTTFNGSLAFAIHKGEIPGLKEFLYSTNPLTLPDDIFTALMWRSAFACLPINATKFRDQLKNVWNCTGQETMKSYENNFDVNNFRLTYAIYRATYAMAYATHDWIYSRNNQQTDVITYLKSNFHASKLNKYLDNVTFKTSSGENFQFENRAPAGQYEIMNWFITPNGTIQYRQIGSYTSISPPGKQFSINEKLIQWHKIFKEVPRSVCSNSCLPGYRKALQKSQQKCCYDCVLCSEGEISNRTDMENCIKCTEHQWSNERRDKCIPRTIDFLSYEDALGIALSILAVLLSALTVTILSIFIKHKETPIVKANNRDLSYILLLSLTLSFLCSLLFIGRPQTITCFFRQAAFGIIFAIAVSSVLAKTITVVIAFNATKPGSESRKWIKARVSTYLVCICAMGEILICFVWFLCNPPFPEFDTSERSLRMTLQCNEGSSIAFYFLIGYIGILAVFSFIVAFLARKLPNTFNEATHITFSMLVFCSVWLSFFPAYLSTKGKYMVAVEIFAMLASGGGLLCCIFLPKCYIIMIRPELNCKEQLIGKKSIKYNVESN
ncbi:vomeronasal type-2 receptor 26-like [Lithobates pipiens]